jgi:mannonate dehydratase
MEQTWRWFGPGDAVTLNDAAQTGATGIVTALHDIPYGVVWSEEAITERRTQIAAPGLGLRWSVVESLPIHEDIKRGTGDLDRLFGAYRDSLRNLARQGLKTVCYNFMPVVDWTRTELRAPLPMGGNALRFNIHEVAAFDCLMLE